MIPFNNKKIRFFYSLNKNFYDVICIGNKAQKVAKLVEQRNKKISLRKLFIKSSNTQFEASLAILGQSKIKISNEVIKGVDTKLRNQILKVDPNRNVLITRNGQQLRFKHLIYSGQDHQWKDKESITGLKQALQNNYTSTYADIQSSNIQELYNKVNSEIYFNIGSGRNFAVDNYFMLHLADYLRTVSQHYGYDFKETKIKILNNQKTLVPFNQQVDSMIKNLLQQNNVEIIDDCKVEQINHRKRQFKVKIKGEQKSLNYGGFYQYLPFKVPQFLAESQINPLNVDQRTLLNKDFPAIHVIGNIAPTAYSFYGYNYMAHTIAQNIINMELKSNKLAVYQGDTAFPFWTGVNSLRYFIFNYEKTTFLNNIGENKWSGLLLGLDKKVMGRKQIQMYLNGNSYGMPYYFTSPKLKQIGKEIKLNRNEQKQALSL